MSNVHVPFEGKAEEKAVLLLEAAEKSDKHDASSVRTVTGAFVVPEELAKAAGVEGSEITSPDLRTREAEIPGLDETVQTHRMGAGPTGAVDTNAGEDAQTGTVAEASEEGSPERGQKMGEPRADRRADKSDNLKQQRPRKRAAAKKSEGDKEPAANEKQE